MLDYLPSVVACCAIYVARKNMGRTCWSPTLEKYTKYQVEQLMPCLTEVNICIRILSTLVSSAFFCNALRTCRYIDVCMLVSNRCGRWGGAAFDE